MHPTDPQARTEEAATHWDNLAARWGQTGLPPAARVQAIREQLACPVGSPVLDAGCGAGHWSVALAQQGYQMSGIDAAPRMIAEARGLAHKLGLDGGAVDFQVGDVAALPYDDARYAGILCVNVLDFVLSPGDALVELWRVLRPGGRLLLRSLGAYSAVKLDWWRWFLPHGYRGPHGNEEGAQEALPAFRGNGIAPWEMEALLGALGWRILAQEPLFGPVLSGATTPYTADMAAHLTDPILRQTIATTWQFVALKPDQEPAPR